MKRKKTQTATVLETTVETKAVGVTVIASSDSGFRF